MISVQVPHTEFDFRRVRFELDTDTNTFQQVSFPDKGIIRDYLRSRGLKNEAEALAALEKWGPNTVEVPAPTFMEMLKEQMIAPFFVFQVRSTIEREPRGFRGNQRRSMQIR